MKTLATIETTTGTIEIIGSDEGYWISDTDSKIKGIFKTEEKALEIATEIANQAQHSWIGSMIAAAK